jgi:hypothetical protein
MSGAAKQTHEPGVHTLTASHRTWPFGLAIEKFLVSEIIGHEGLGGPKVVGHEPGMVGRICLALMPAPSLRKISSTGMRVPLITGLPPTISGLILIRS